MRVDIDNNRNARWLQGSGNSPAPVGTPGAPRPGAASRVGDGTWTTPTVQGVPLRFRYDDFDIRGLPVPLRSDVRAPAPLVDTGAHDRHGVRMYEVDGRLWDHPVAQAQYGLYLVDSHRLSGDRRHLERAVRQAQRLLDRRVAHQGGWFYPYSFETGLHSGPERFAPPWFSMLAQGQALSLFCRLAEVTGEGRWRAGADATFASYLLPPVAGRPWGVYVVDGLLWLEEYPFPDRVTGDRTYNGHLLSTMGLWEYWVLTRREEAKLLLRGALTTARDAYPLMRNPGWRSKYCLRHGFDLHSYHVIHTVQQATLYGITGDPVFAQIADLFYADSPPSDAGTVALAAGRHTGHRFDRDGRTLAEATVTLSRRASVPSGGRVRIKDRPGLWYVVTGGRLAGYHLPESPRAVRRGVFALLRYRAPRRSVVAAAPLIAYASDSQGHTTAVTSSHRVGDPVTVDARASLGGVEHLRLATGEHSGRWIRATAVNLDP